MEGVPSLHASLIGILTFQVFLTPAVLVGVYYIGALFGPWLSWWMVMRARRSPVPDATIADRPMAEALRVPPYLNGGRGWLVGILVLLALELGWRMLFELLIAFFDMHDALIAIRNAG
ncbi:MAG: DUF4282 domain-containing protein [Gammaproteobacteria bacterium]|nr:DUF4282 domain-containing protein [Gammaproteobacteria bacterium]MCP5137336.1 DUF4282 domain-containing protein [Gammaproteobacteria bacterium]